MAFPTTPILDNCNRADESPLSDGGQWSNPIQVGGGHFDLVSNSIVFGSTAPSAYWNVKTFGPNSEVYVDVLAFGSQFVDVFVRMVNEGTASRSSYTFACIPSGNGTAQIFKTINGTNTTLASFAVSVLDGGSIGVRVIDSSIFAYAYNAGWMLVGQVSDSSLLSAGHIGILASSVSCTLDNFGGGTFILPPTPQIGGGQGTFIMGKVQSRLGGEFIG